MYTGRQKIVKHFAKSINYWMIYQEMETNIIHLIVNRLSHLTPEQVQQAKKVDG